MPDAPIRLHGAAIKIESTYGTDPVPDPTTDAIRLVEPIELRPEYLFPNTAEDEANSSIWAAKPTAVPRGRFVRFEVAWRVRGAGAAYSASVVPEADPILRGGPFSRATDFSVGTEKLTDTLADSGFGSFTLYGYRFVAPAKIRLYKIVGCRAGFAMPSVAGQLGVIRFPCLGLLTAAPAEIGAMPAFGYNTSAPPAFVGSGTAIGAYNPSVVGEVNWNLNVTPELVESANGVDGIAEVTLIPESPLIPTVEILTRVTDLATFDPEAEVLARTKRTIVSRLGATGAPGQYLRVTNTATDAVCTDVVPAEHKGHAAWRLTYQFERPDYSSVWD